MNAVVDMAEVEASAAEVPLNDCFESVSWTPWLAVQTVVGALPGFCRGV